MENDRQSANPQIAGSINIEPNTDPNTQQNASQGATAYAPQNGSVSPVNQQGAPQNNGEQSEKKWPWVILGIAVALILLIGGCTSCSVLTFGLSDSHNFLYDDHGFGSGHHNGQRSYDDPDDYNGGKYFSDTYTLDELIDSIGINEGDTSGDKFSTGMYFVGEGINPGLYFLEGTDSTAGYYYVFRAADHKEGSQVNYRVDQAVVYIGNYFAEFDEGDLVFFLPPEETKTMFIAPPGPINVGSPIKSGCYRVGIDIPAGEYVVTVDSAAAQAALSVYMDPSVFIMNNMQFDDSQTTDEYDVYSEGPQRVKVKDGDYLELFATQATPAPSA